MEIHFDKEYLQQLYEEGKTKDKKYRFQPQMVKRYQLRIKTLEYVQNIEELYAIRSFHYEVLKGDKAGISSIRVNDQYRIEFTVKQINPEKPDVPLNKNDAFQKVQKRRVQEKR